MFSTASIKYSTYIRSLDLVVFSKIDKVARDPNTNSEGKYPSGPMVSLSLFIVSRSNTSGAIISRSRCLLSILESLRIGT